MRKNINKIFLIVSLSSFCLLLGLETASARYYTGKGQGPKPTNTAMKVAAGCDPPTSQIDLDINNVRAKLLNGGDMWWDIFGGGNARYEIPKVEPGQRSVHSSFASALWFGGVDDGNQLKTAGQTYRQRGIDFWPGPLDTTSAEVTADVCQAFDKHFNVYQKDIIEFQAGKEASAEMLKWPGNGNSSLGQAEFLAPFADVDGDGIYNPGSGDYPTLDPNVLGAKPDQMIWWVYNDKGGAHTAYIGGEPIGLEIQSLAFGFSTSNEINNMTFYKYRVANRASSPLYDTYFGVFTDSDLGGADDDYVGCNMALVDPDGAIGPLPAKRRSFAYTYNADAIDEDGSSPGYGATPPIFGIDFFRGPKDENGDELPMSTFMFFTNQGVNGINADPQNATELYRYLRGFWADGAILSYGTPTGRGGTDQCNYAFPGVTDPNGRPAWNESDVAGDRRMVQSAGPFTLQPGAINEVIIGAVWSRATSGDNTASIATGIIADDKAQVLFDNDFKLANGPDPVTVVLNSSNEKITISLESTDKTEKYSKSELDNEDLVAYTYKFQGYRIFQMKNGTVSAAEITDGSKAVEIAQVDIVDGITTVINKKFDPLTNNDNAKIEVDGDDKGIKHVFELTTDAFSTAADGKIVNGKTYYFLVVPYAYSSTAVKTKYLPGRTSTTVYSVTVGRQVINGLINGRAEENLPITRNGGYGNGGANLEITAASEAAVVANTSGVPVSYEIGKGPVFIKVYDPSKIQKRSYTLRFTNDMKSYVLLDANNLADTLMISDTTYSPTNTLTDNQQIAEIRKFRTLPNGKRVLESRTSLGFYIVVDNTIGKPGANAQLENNNFLSASVTFADPTKAWLQGYNGRLQLSTSNPPIAGWVEGNLNIDPENVYGNILGATWAPYKVLRYVSGGGERTTPLFNPTSKSAANSKLDSVGSYDIVFTSDTTKWSECVVIESGVIGPLPTPEVTEGNQKRFNLRKKDIGYGIGKSKFPGYAINLETGERVNIFFAEASGLTSDNGNDMLWNPTSNTNFYDKGGRHFVYVTRRRYDKCNEIHELLTKSIDATTNADKFKIFGMVDWVTVPILRAGETLLSTDVKVRLRVAKPYDKNASDSTLPSFTFNDIDVLKGATTDDNTNKKLALELINIVPNPYYAYSSYEPDRNDFRVRVTNLPASATVTIYTSNGILVRRFSKSDPLQTYVEWDLRNANRIPIASGVYIIHVNCPGVGEKTLKWMGVMRPTDFTNF